ncbi:hypothetical protein EAG_01940 [Camponotus floridanus]|uniref:Uncharacterized protein n=1 Tax=Camponotus floridanus TaxID=104421 RepID=E1ZZP3_CAMFO|nr:hypothetical protein EAG_01940 [Camponotus floridanus]
MAAVTRWKKDDAKLLLLLFLILPEEPPQVENIFDLATLRGVAPHIREMSSPSAEYCPHILAVNFMMRQRGLGMRFYSRDVTLSPYQKRIVRGKYDPMQLNIV